MEHGRVAGEARAAGEPGPGMAAITLAEALQLEPLREIRVLAGASGLHRPVHLVNVIDGADIADWALEGELLLTTGFTSRDGPERLAALIPALAAKGAAGLGIQPWRDGTGVPGAVVKQAEHHGFPLLEIPHRLAFSEIIGPVMQAVAQRQAEATLAIDRVQRHLLQLVLQGAGLRELCAAVAQRLGRPVWIEDARGQVVAAAPDGDTGTGAAVTRCPGIGRQPASSRSDAPGPSGSPGGAQGPGVSDRPDTAGVAGAAAGRETPGAGPWRAPIASGGRFFGYLCAASPGRPWRAAEAGVLERGAAIIALEWGKQEAIVEVKRRYRKEFLDRLLAGNPLDPDQVIEQARVLGWQLDRPHTVVVFGPAGGASWAEATARHQLLKAAEVVLAMAGGEPAAGIRDGLVVALVPGDPGDAAGRRHIHALARAVLRSFASSTCAGAARPRSAAAPARLLAAGARAGSPTPGTGAAPPAGGGAGGAGPAVAPFPSRPGGTGSGARQVVVAGVGRAAPAPEELARSYREARTALRAAHAGGEPVQFFADLGVLRLLHNQPTEELARFVDDYLGPLLAYDRRHDAKLVETLAAFFQHGGNMKRMARALFTHYNTVAYRLQRIRQISGLDLKNPDHLLNAQVALQALRLLGGGPAGPPGDSSGG